ncbi:MAG: hypothetical protein RL701_3863 [Pseudomonadota bacterium]
MRTDLLFRQSRQHQTPDLHFAHALQTADHDDVNSALRDRATERFDRAAQSPRNCAKIVKLIQFCLGRRQAYQSISAGLVLAALRDILNALPGSCGVSGPGASTCLSCGRAARASTGSVRGRRRRARRRRAFLRRATMLLLVRRALEVLDHPKGGSRPFRELRFVLVPRVRVKRRLDLLLREEPLTDQEVECAEQRTVMVVAGLQGIVDCEWLVATFEDHLDEKTTERVEPVLGSECEFVWMIGQLESAHIIVWIDGEQRACPDRIALR